MKICKICRNFVFQVNITLSGKWMYEILLGTPGLMQVGWCTASCKFNREEGVGDTKNSFAYDGYRESKWNARNSIKYGEVLLKLFVFSLILILFV